MAEAEKFKARREGHPDSVLTVEEYWALPEPDRSETQVLIGEAWVRPNRFISDGSDITIERSTP